MEAGNNAKICQTNLQVVTLNLLWWYDQSCGGSICPLWIRGSWDFAGIFFVRPKPSQLLKQSATYQAQKMTHQSTTCTIYNWKLQRFFVKKTTFHPLSIRFPSTFHPPSSPASTRHGTNTHPLGRLHANRGDPEPSTTSLALTPLRCVPSWSWIRIRTAEKKHKGMSWLIAWECTHTHIIYIYIYHIFRYYIYINIYTRMYYMLYKLLYIYAIFTVYIYMCVL